MIAVGMIVCITLVVLCLSMAKKIEDVSTQDIPAKNSPILRHKKPNTVSDASQDSQTH